MGCVTFRTVVLATLGFLIRVPAAFGQSAEDLRAPLAAVRAHAAVTLGQRGDLAAVPPLIEALADPEPRVRWEAARALGLLRDRRAVPPLVKSLRDDQRNVRMYAAYALGEIKDPSAADNLIGAMNDPDGNVRDQVAWALRELKTSEARQVIVSLIADDATDAAQLGWILQGFERRPVVDDVCRLLGSSDPVTRQRALRVLRDLSSEPIPQAVVDALRDADIAVRRLALGMLQSSRDERVVSALEKMAAVDEDAELRSTAAEAVRVAAGSGNLAAHWSFDDGNLDVARDVTGAGNDGTIEACTSVPGKRGLALQFADTSGVELGRPAGLPTAQQPFTVMAWVRADQDSGVVVARGGAFCGYSLYLKEGVPKFGIHCDQTSPTYIATGTARVVGTWVQLAGVVRKDRIELFVDGQRVATTPTTGYLASNCGQGMEIGFDRGNSAVEITDHFVGIIDEVQVFQADLSADELVRQYRTAF
jgi:HEAT repeat protein